MADPITTERLARLRHLHEAATAGPWGWRGHDDGQVELCTLHSGQLRVIAAQRSEPCIVELYDESVSLTFEACDSCQAKWAEVERTGNGDLWEGYRCPKPEDLGTVWLWDPRGFISPANTWAAREQPYRSDVARVDHPDAELIAEARNTLPALLDEIERLRALHDRWCDFQNRLVPVLRSLGVEQKVMDRLGGAPRPGCQHTDPVLDALGLLKVTTDGPGSFTVDAEALTCCAQCVRFWHLIETPTGKWRHLGAGEEDRLLLVLRSIAQHYLDHRCPHDRQETHRG